MGKGEIDKQIDRHTDGDEGGDCVEKKETPRTSGIDYHFSMHKL